MPIDNELYRLEMESAARIFGDKEFLSVNELSRRIGKSYEATRALFPVDKLPPVGISRARYAQALARKER